MKGDFTRKTFRKKAHYRKVNMQQGRVQTDADWNEQIDIQAHHETTFLTDVIGRVGAPNENSGFQLTPAESGYVISKGRYYVDGILCENEEDVKATEQPDIKLVYFDWDDINSISKETKRFIDFLRSSLISLSALDWLEWEKTTLKRNKEKTEIIIASKSDPKNSFVAINLVSGRSKETRVLLSIGHKGGKKELAYSFGVKVSDDGKKVKFGYTSALPRGDGYYLAYLEVWERHLTHLDDPRIREVALGGPDTSTRVKTIWQVKLLPVSTDSDKFSCQSISLLPEWKQLVASGDSSGNLQARAQPTQSATEPCELPPLAGYRRLENQLYRVEIHNGGNTKNDTIKFKWSRDNGTVVTSVKNIDSSEHKITVSDTGKDSLLGFSGTNLWVEVTDDYHELEGLPGTVVRLGEVKNNFLSFDIDTVVGDPLTNESYPQEYHPKVRRWESEQHNSALAKVNIKEYIKLEDGIEVKFSEGNYRCGNYWFIPARTATADIEWPTNGDEPTSREPDGDQHHFAPLMLLKYGEGALTIVEDCRGFFLPANSPTLHYVSGDGQEAMSGTVLLTDLKVLVTKGEKPVKGAKIGFKVTVGNGVIDLGGKDPTMKLAETDVNGFASCSWILGDNPKAQQVKATLLGPDEKPSIVPLYFNASIITQTADLSAKSGLIDLTVDSKRASHIYGTFKHFLSGIKIPPAIMLGLVSTNIEPSDNDNITVKFTEDYQFTHLNSKPLKFKPIDIDLIYFKIQFDSREITPELKRVMLRFWAIAAEEVDLQSDRQGKKNRLPKAGS